MPQTWPINLHDLYEKLLRNISSIFTKVFLVMAENQKGTELNQKRSPSNMQTMSLQALQARYVYRALTLEAKHPYKMAVSVRSTQLRARILYETRTPGMVEQTSQPLRIGETPKRIQKC